MLPPIAGTRSRETIDPPIDAPPAIGTSDLEVSAFTSYLVARWRIFAIALGIALPVVIVGSLLMPKQYSATASMLIEPPAGNDPRGSTAVSPVYLESLKTYEHFASSDSLFSEALDRLGLKTIYSGTPIETVKRKVLYVTKPRDTKILQVTATLEDPVKARDLSLFIARATVERNRSLDESATSDLTRGGDAVLASARKQLDMAKEARATAIEKEPVASLEAEVGSGGELKNFLTRELSSARTELAAYTARVSSGKQGPAYMDSQTAKEAAAAEEAQIASLSTQLDRLNADLAPKFALLEARKQRREVLEREATEAQQQFDAATTHRNEILESIAFRGERLQIIDGGVVPQKPSSPNIVLNVGVAIGGCLLGCLFYLAVTFARSRRRYLMPGQSWDSIASRTR